MDPKEHLADFIQAVAKDDIEAAREAHAKYVELQSSVMVNEDHDKLLTDVGIRDFLKTLHTRAKKAGKEEPFFKELSKATGKDCVCADDFTKTVTHFSKDKKNADKFIHQVEKALSLTKDDPAKDIEGKT